MDAERLESIDGIDFELALDYLMGERELIVYLLYQLSDGDLGDASREVERLLAAGDMESAERAAHSLKSVAGMVGALGLEGLAGVVEASIRDGSRGEQLEQLRGRMESVHIALAAEIRAALDGHVPPAPGDL